MTDPRTAWEAEYERGRYLDEPPVAFVGDIVAAARASGVSGGLYIGCGNGRNYLPLVDAGLDLVGIDVSPTAIEQLRARSPERRGRLIAGDLGALPADARYELVVGIQVFQHGSRAEAHAHIRAAHDRLAPDGLFCIRVNAAGTDVWPEHEITEKHADGGFTVRYLAGAKRGLEIHFFSRSELEGLLDGFEVVLPPRIDVTRRRPPGPAQWSQWEAIWRKALLR